jgi:hypothetical protein
MQLVIPAKAGIQRNHYKLRQLTIYEISFLTQIVISNEARNFTQLVIPAKAGIQGEPIQIPPAEHSDCEN